MDASHLQKKGYKQNRISLIHSTQRLWIYKTVKNGGSLPIKSIVDVFASYAKPLSDSCTSFNANVIPRVIALPKQCK